MQTELVLWVLIGIIGLLLAVIIYNMTLYKKSVDSLSEKLLARSLSEVKMLQSFKGNKDGYEIVFPYDDETMALKEENTRKKRRMQLEKEKQKLDKEMDKVFKTKG